MDDLALSSNYIFGRCLFIIPNFILRVKFRNILHVVLRTENSFSSRYVHSAQIFFIYVYLHLQSCAHYGIQ